MYKVVNMPSSAVAIFPMSDTSNTVSGIFREYLLDRATFEEFIGHTGAYQLMKVHVTTVPSKYKYICAEPV